MFDSLSMLLPFDDHMDGFDTRPKLVKYHPSLLVANFKLPIRHACGILKMNSKWKEER